MRYIVVNWNHSNPADPVTLYSELDEQGWEHRKVELFANGRCGYADRCGSAGGTRLGIEPVPSLKEIAADPQFEPVEITCDEFEQVWAKRDAS